MRKDLRHKDLTQAPAVFPPVPAISRPREAIAPQERDRRQREDRCYRCGQKRHFAFNCPLGRNQDVKPKICTAVADMLPEERAELKAQLDQVEDSTITEDFQDAQQ